MSAIMISCLSILGRKQDRVTHVLVDSQFETAKPRFYYPAQAQQNLTDNNNGTILAKDANVRLFDVPWVPFRTLLEKNLRLRNKPNSYTSFVAALRGDIERHVEKPSYRWIAQTNSAEIVIGSKSYTLKSQAAALFHFLLTQAEKGVRSYPSHKDAKLNKDLNSYLASDYPGKESIQWKEFISPEPLRKYVLNIRAVIPDVLLHERGVLGLMWGQTSDHKD